jgi:hypothetical protein
MIPPTLENLKFLADHTTADAVMTAATAIPTPTAILPKLRIDADGRVIGVVLPDEPDYSTLP